MFEFLKQLAGVKTRQLAQEATNLIATIDTDAAIQADLKVMEKDLDAAGKLIAELRAAYNREVKEFEAVEKRYRQHFTAAETLKARLDSAITPADEKPSIEAGLSDLVAQLERLVPEMEKEKQDVVEAEILLKEAEAAYRDKGEALKKARATLEDARRDLQRAEIDAARAREQAEKSARVAGLRDDSQGSGLNVGLNAMAAKAEKLRQEAEAARLKSTTLGADSKPANVHVAQALAEAEGKPSTDQRSLADRLAALKK